MIFLKSPPCVVEQLYRNFSSTDMPLKIGKTFVKMHGKRNMELWLLIYPKIMKVETSIENN